MISGSKQKKEWKSKESWKLMKMKTQPTEPMDTAKAVLRVKT
jgi:hypothetical protein